MCNVSVFLSHVIGVLVVIRIMKVIIISIGLVVVFVVLLFDFLLFVYVVATNN